MCPGQRLTFKSGWRGRSAPTSPASQARTSVGSRPPSRRSDPALPPALGKVIKMTIHRMYLSTQLYLRGFFFSHRNELLSLNKLLSAPARESLKSILMIQQQLRARRPASRLWLPLLPAPLPRSPPFPPPPTPRVPRVFPVRLTSDPRLSPAPMRAVRFGSGNDRPELPQTPQGKGRGPQ